MKTSISCQRFDLEAAGRRLHAQRIEPEGAQGPTLVFLHEGLGSIGQWKEFPAQLCRDCALPGLVYERWGFGRSEPLTEPRRKDYLYYEALDSLPAVLERCGIAEPPILIGHSDGGTIALLFAAAFPERPRAIITEAAHVFVEQVTLDGIRTAKEFYETTDLRRRLALYHGPNTDAMFRGWSDTWLREDFRDWNIIAELPKITCPALILQGKDDEYGTPAQVETIAANVSGPVETVLLPDCAHVPHHQARARVLALMQQFIQKVCKPVAV
ncbi:MAG: alpha/beta hydrolase [Candidatus Competibacteraceae bacterium]